MKKIVSLYLLLLSLFVPQPAFAHAFGTQYTLPIPFTLYFYGAAGALIISFVVIGFFIRQTKKSLLFPTKDITKAFVGKILTKPWFLRVGQALSVFLFLLTIITGLIGVNDFAFNFNMTFFWIIFLLGTAYMTALTGNFYRVLNPFFSLVSLSEYVWNASSKPIFTYPKKLGYFPALLGYFFLIYFELIGDVTPHKLSVVLLIYSCITFLGVILFGKNDWLEKAEFFGVFFALLSWVSPLAKEKKHVVLRVPFTALVEKRIESFSLLLFILFMLSSTAFDGFRETTVWGNISSALSTQMSSLFGLQTAFVIDTVFLILSPFFFLGIYIVILLLTKLVVHTSESIYALALAFAPSLIPIALVYNIAHYYTFLLIQGQDIIRLISDPFGYGWNIFQTANFTPNISLLPTTLIWQTEVAFLLSGHIVAVYISHLIALKVFPSHKKAVISQFPMLFLMVLYTVLGLWILSQPLSVGK